MNLRLCLLLLILLPSLGSAQQVDTVEPTKNKLYLGLSFSTVSYHIYYRNLQATKDVRTGYFAPLAVNLRYQLSDRVRIQVGLAYGGSTHRHTWSPGVADTLQFNTYSKTHVLALPLTGRFVFFNLYKRLPIYGSATLMPAFGSTRTRVEEMRHGDSSTILAVKDKGTNVFMTAAIGIDYKISRRFEGFAEYYFYKYNLTGRNSFNYDWDQGITGLFHLYKSVGIGVNYKL